MGRSLFAPLLRSVSRFRTTFSCALPTVRWVVFVIAVAILIGKANTANASVTLTFQGTGSDADVSFQFVSPVPLNTPGLSTTFSFTYCHPPSGESCDQVNYSAGSGVLRFTAVGSSVDTRTFEFSSFVNNGTYSTLASSPNSGNLTVTGSTNALVLNPTSLPFGTYNEAYSQTISASGGTAPYTYTVTPANSLPPGLMLSSSGVLSGTPTVPGSFSFTVTATDKPGDNGSRAYTLIIGNTWIVTTSSDHATGTASNCPGPNCSLRDALAAAAADSGDEITFDPTRFSTPQTITLASTLNLPSNTTIAGAISGSGASLTNMVTVSGGGSSSNFPVFTVNAGVTGAAISNLIIANGHIDSQGGGISNEGSLVVTNSTLENNYAGGYVTGVGNGGGAIFNDATLTIVGSTFAGNTSAPGGAINANSGQVTITNSTFYGNSAIDGRFGGAIFINTDGTVAVNDSTFSGNSAAGGGAIFNNNTLTVKNSILSGNTGGDCGAGGASTCPTNGNNGNVIDVSNVDLAPLGNYGGPTQTMLPQPGSAAICAGDHSLVLADVTNDQRDFARTNITYTGYSSSNPCVDAGAVQTNYQSVQFSNSSYRGSANKAINPAPVVSVTENGQNIGGVPITLNFSGTGTPSGLGPVATVAGVGASFSALSVNRGGSDTLSVALPITSGDTLSDSATLDIAAAAAPTTTTASNASAAASSSVQSVTLNATVTSSGGTVNEGTVTFTVLQGATVIGVAASGGVTNGNAVVNYALPGGIAAGTYTIEAAYTDSSNNFAASSDKTHTLTVTRGSYVLNIAANNPAWGTVSPASGASYAAGSKVTITATAAPGHYFVNWTGSSDIANTSSASTTITMNGLENVTANFAVVPTSLSLVSQTASPVYGSLVTFKGAFTPASANVTSSDFQFIADYGTANQVIVSVPSYANGTVTVTYGRFKAGPHTAIVKFLGTTDYAATVSNTVNITVAQAQTAVNWSSAQTIEYGTNLSTLLTAKGTFNNQQLQGTVTYTAQTGSSVAVPVTGTTVLNAGTYTLTATFMPADTIDYTTATQTTTLTVTKAPLAVTANNATKAYGAALPSLTGTITGLVNGDNITATYTTTATASSPVGTYPITATLSDPNGRLPNYTLTVNQGTLTITQYVLTVTANNATRAYGTPNPAFTGTVTGAVNGDSFNESFTTTATLSSSVGTYPIVPSVMGTNLSDYSVTIDNGTLTVTQATTTTILTVSNATITPGQNLTFDGTGEIGHNRNANRQR